MKKTVFCVALAAAMSIGNASAAQSGQSGAAPTTSPLLSPAQRGDMAREFVRRAVSESGWKTWPAGGVS